MFYIHSVEECKKRNISLAQTFVFKTITSETEKENFLFISGKIQRQKW